jgi:integrase
MRTKAVFSVFGRKLPSGKLVYYYQCYDDKGKRKWARSTGATKKTEAVAYCMRLYRDGLLIPAPKVPTFGEFSEGWWDVNTCRYLKWRQLRDPLSPNTIDIFKNSFNNHIKDFFARYRLDEITGAVLENWFLSMTEKKLKASSINLAYRALRIMLTEAARLKLLNDNPCKESKVLKEEETEREILTVEEVKKLFPAGWDAVWENPVAYKANRLAACTGLRIGEVRGLRRESVFDDYLCIAGQYGRHGYIPHTKTKHNRNIPISALTRGELDELLKMNGDGYVFSEDGGATPIPPERINRQFNRALERIGISHEERKKRNLSFHAWRHFFNTLLRMSNVADSKVQSVTGHRSMRMTDHYTHFDTRQFSEIRDVQVKLLASETEATKPKGAKRKAAAPKPAKRKSIKKARNEKQTGA